MRHKKTSHKLSEHFSKRDFLCKCGKCEDSIKISLGLLGGLELLRSLAKSRINIVKGFECLDSAESTGKFRRNHHTLGIAADITVDKRTPKEIFALAQNVPEFKGIGLNITSQYVHVDTRKDPERSLWIEDGGEHIPLTEENSANYL